MSSSNRQLVPDRCPRCQTGRLCQDIDGISCLNCGHPLDATDDRIKHDAWQALVEKAQDAHKLPRHEP